MLTLKRKEGESVVIQNNDIDIVIKIKYMESNTVSLGIDAPSNYTILREELLQNNLL